MMSQSCIPPSHLCKSPTPDNQKNTHLCWSYTCALSAAREPSARGGINSKGQRLDSGAGATEAHTCSYTRLGGIETWQPYEHVSCNVHTLCITLT
jgi:hypothetical protein